MKELDLITITSQQSFINYCFQNSSEDVAYWENWLKENPEYKEQITELKTSILLLPIPASEKVIEHDYQKLQNNIAGISNKATARKLTLWPIITGMVAAVAIIVVGIYLYKYKLDNSQNQTNTFANDITPGKQGATLTLASGKQIQLTNAANGELANESGVTITKTATGELIYQINDQTQASQNITNTLNTAKGETYQVVLPDGSKVWLNAASTLTYPAKFTSLNQRKVQLDGEAYFEIAKDKTHPFIVASGNQEITVLGTHFNINNYKDEKAAKTTLLEGSVKISSTINKGTEKTLKPGEQAILNDKGELKVSEVITSDAIAWKNGKFVFDDESIESIMQKLSRWYNVEVIYDGENVKEIPFTGSISRYDNISKILDKISYTQNIHFKIEGRRVTVMK
ncbi:hypothetical protein ASU31_10500 [Pedobacter ginsenosidimutans]|uniref:Anti-sigma factor n=1 Tax=Pedobacter ginsenosidimutans TaxID=687842 RepID=A0A0T5VPY4_9SPHI|nr:FecR family protein [Pedobacter ginsenosidimutans]KRT15932.1 hypothetical protein ASU31_10500 [Pedobacter ginsenosidimutans]